VSMSIGFEMNVDDVVFVHVENGRTRAAIYSKCFVFYAQLIRKSPENQRLKGKSPECQRGGGKSPEVRRFS